MEKLSMNTKIESQREPNVGRSKLRPGVLPQNSCQIEVHQIVTGVNVC